MATNQQQQNIYVYTNKYINRLLHLHTPPDKQITSTHAINPIKQPKKQI